MDSLGFVADSLLLMTFSDGHSVVLPSSETTEYVRVKKEEGVTVIFSSLVV